MKRRTALTALLALAAATVASLASARTVTGIANGITSPGMPIYTQPDTSSADFLQPYVQWMTTDPQGSGYTYSVGYTLVTNRGDGLASYSSGTLSYSPGLALFLNGKFVILPASFNGTSSQLFSDRLYAWPDPNNQFNFPTYPFNPFQADNLGLSIDPATGNVTLTLKSWGNTAITFDTVADPNAGVIYGFAQKGSANPRQMVVISLQKHSTEIPR